MIVQGPIGDVSFQAQPVGWTPSEGGLSWVSVRTTEGGGELRCGLDPTSEAPRPPTVIGLPTGFLFYSRQGGNIPTPLYDCQESITESLALFCGVSIAFPGRAAGSLAGFRVGGCGAQGLTKPRTSGDTLKTAGFPAQAEAFPVVREAFSQAGFEVFDGVWPCVPSTSGQQNQKDCGPAHRVTLLTNRSTNYTKGQVHWFILFFVTCTTRGFSTRITTANATIPTGAALGWIANLAAAAIFRTPRTEHKEREQKTGDKKSHSRPPLDKEKQCFQSLIIKAHDGQEKNTKCDLDHLTGDLDRVC